MIKMTAAIRRKPGMTQKEFFSYIVNVHGSMTKANPLTIRRYVQNHVVDSAFGAATDPAYQMVFHRDSVTELTFDSFESMGRTFSDPYVKEKMGPDGRNFSDLSTSLALVVREVDYPLSYAGQGDVKVLHFLRKPDELPLPEFFKQWHAAHEKVMQISKVAEPLRGYIQNLQVPEGDPILAYFGGEGMPVYEGYASLWYDEADALTSFRAYQREVEATLADTPFFLPAQSFFLMAREVTILG